MCQDNLFDASGEGDGNRTCKCPDLGTQRLPSCVVDTIHGAPTASVSSCNAVVATSGSSLMSAYLIHGSSSGSSPKQAGSNRFLAPVYRAVHHDNLSGSGCRNGDQSRRRTVLQMGLGTGLKGFVVIPVNVANVADVADADKSYHFRSQNHCTTD